MNINQLPKDAKDYKATKDCAVAKVGDHIILWDGMDGIYYYNVTQDTMGCPFIELDCVKAI